MEYHWTEHHGDELKKALADTIITIAHRDSYHLEIQMYSDEEIVLCVFEYGYRHALTTRGGTDVLIFPEPKILYLYEDGGAESKKTDRPDSISASSSAQGNREGANGRKFGTVEEPDLP